MTSSDPTSNPPSGPEDHAPPHDPLPPLPPGPDQALQPWPAPAKPLGQDAGIRLLLPVGRSGWAIIAGYAGLLSVLLIPAPIALATGIIAILDIRKSRQSPNPKHGMGRAIFGIVMGTLGSILLIMLIVSLATAP